MAEQTAAGPGTAGRMPRGLKIATGVIWFQAVVNLLVGWVLFSSAATFDEHGVGERYGSGLLRTIGVVSVVIGLLLAVCGVLVVRRAAWVRPTVIGLEAVGILSSLIALFSGGAMPSLVGIAVGAAVIRQFASADAAAWFNRR
ncbi:MULTISPECIES: hypothetical protein [Kitasatospora]|uniref:Integral membrane protein n=1 Tax=Kitasatospora cystarginea TaxID=58350 RepID=A0ABP5QNB1_9ACTN